MEDYEGKKNKKEVKVQKSLICGIILLSLVINKKREAKMAVPWPHEVIKIESTGESDWICSCTRIKGSYLIDHNGCKIPLVVKSNGRTIVDLENATGGLENASISIMGTQINLAQRRNLARIEIFPEENTPVIYILADKKEGKSLSIIFLSEAIRP